MYKKKTLFSPAKQSNFDKKPKARTISDIFIQPKNIDFCQRSQVSFSILGIVILRSKLVKPSGRKAKVRTFRETLDSRGWFNLERELPPGV